MIEACQYTTGEYTNEADAGRDFDTRVRSMGAFAIVQSEQWGEYVHGSVLSERSEDGGPKRPRLDRLLVPNDRLYANGGGWTLGPIGVEIKASGVKLGRVVAQILDYRNGLFPSPHGAWLSPVWWFLYPCQHVYGDIESVMSQNRIGFACPDSRGGVSFYTSGTRLIGMDGDRLIAKTPASGAKRGSR